MPLFANLADCEVVRILDDARGRARRFPSGSVIVNECDAAKELVVVVSGSVSVQVVGVRDGDRAEVQRLGNGDMFGMALVVAKLETYPAMLIAKKSCEVLFLSFDAIRRWFVAGEHVRFLANLYMAMSKDSYFAWRKLMLLTCYRISDRVLMFLRWRASDGHPAAFEFTYPELAATLGVNRTALYRAVASLVKKRKITAANGKMRLR